MADRRQYRQERRPVERCRPDSELMLGLLDTLGPLDALLGRAQTPRRQLDVGQSHQDHGDARRRRQADLRLVPFDVRQRQPVALGRLLVLSARRQQEREALA